MSFHSTTVVQERWFHPLDVTLEAVGKEVYFNCHNGLEGVDNISWWELGRLDFLQLSPQLPSVLNF